jgi:hypothetical protein
MVQLVNWRIKCWKTSLIYPTYQRSLPALDSWPFGGLDDGKLKQRPEELTVDRLSWSSANSVSWPQIPCSVPLLQSSSRSLGHLNRPRVLDAEFRDNNNQTAGVAQPLPIEYRER